MILTIGIALLAGLVSFLSPCILPIIPGFLSYLAGSSLSESSVKRGQIFLTSVFFVLGFAVVFSAVGVLLNTILAAVAYDVQIWLGRIGGILIIVFGLYLTGLLKIPFLQKEYKFSVKKKFRSRYLTGFVFGAAFAAGWTPCVGAVLGSILSLAATAPGSAFGLLLAYSIGLGIPFLVVGLFASQAARFIQKYNRFFSYATIVFGLVLIVMGVLAFTQNLSKVTNFGITAKDIPIASTVVNIPTKNLPRAKELTDIAGYINTDSISIKDLIGKKVILVDFWTYSCINCQRTTPYLNEWYKKYHDQGLEIIGVNTPEFEFEKKYENVKAAVEKFGIKYPVVLDNTYGTWSAYGNRYWPHKYLIDIDGYIVYDHIGEGGYEESERAIQAALLERMTRFNMPGNIDATIAKPQVDVPTEGKPMSQETYFGADRNEYLGNGTQGRQGVQKLQLPTSVKANTLYLSGDWDFKGEYAQNTSSGAHIVFPYQAKDLYMVASAASTASMHILVDGKPISAEMRGEDVSTDGVVNIKEDRLYTLIKDSKWGQHTIEIIIDNPGLNAYTFTFG